MEDFTKLDVWQKGMELVKEVYSITSQFPHEEQYGLSSQLKSSATSILGNLAEGFSRQTKPDKAHKYTISRGECSETRAFLLIAIELKFISAAQAERAQLLVQDVGKMLTGLIQRYSS
jgi:four helix bundle protein